MLGATSPKSADVKGVEARSGVLFGRFKPSFGARFVPLLRAHCVVSLALLALACVCLLQR